MKPGQGRIIIGIDPHKASWTAAAIDTAHDVLATVRVSTSDQGYAELRRFAEAWPQAEWAVEGAAGLGGPLTRRLTHDGVRVLDVPAKLGARVRVLDHGHGRKNDPADAASVAVAAFTSRRVRPVVLDESHETLRLLTERREDLVVIRTQTVNRLHALLVHLIPGGAPHALKADKAAAPLRSVHANDSIARTRRTLARDLIADLRRVDGQIKDADAEITQAVAASGSTLTELHGIGPALAGRFLGRIGDIDRFDSEAQFASYCGVAPIDVSSGDHTRHRLSRAGDRKLNHSLHMMALTQTRSHPEGRAYYKRKRAAGKTHNEAMRCLKRRLAAVVYRCMNRDKHPMTGLGGHPGATTNSCAASSTVNDGPIVTPWGRLNVDP